ncbi:SUF system Fe-S cluster assembly protein [Thalassobaculum salexigens]|uniref:SUF system Fe-S cluster assembly protein n=1 Tax=Thalassobaculum salexigens TaxID=455360 RepID=UPI00048B43D8
MNHELGLHDFMPGTVGPDGMARAGAPLDDPKGPADEQTIIEALKTVHDPEIPVNLYDLGLIYDIERFDDGSVKIEMTLTAPACPVAGEMPKMVADAVAKAEGVGEVEVTLVWDPPWTKARMSEEARLLLDMF